MSHDVFISYSTKDKPTAAAVCAALEADGIRCWIAPRDVLPGTDWGGSIVQAITHSRAMILIFSSGANHSPQIKREVERAASKEIPIVPFRIEDVIPSGTLEYYLGTPHWLDALTPPLEPHLRQLSEGVKLLLSIPSGKEGAGSGEVLDSVEARKTPTHLRPLSLARGVPAFGKRYLPHVIYWVLAGVASTLTGYVTWLFGEERFVNHVRNTSGRRVGGGDVMFSNYQREIHSAELTRDILTVSLVTATFVLFIFAFRLWRRKKR